MTARDRNVLIGVGTFVLLAAAWFLLLSPIRKDSKALDGQLITLQTRAAAAQAGVAAGQRAQAAHRRDVATVARLGKAVPAGADTASLLVQLQGAAERAGIDFRSIELAASTGAPAAATPAAQVAAVGAAEKGQPAPTGATGATGAVGPVPATQTAAAALPPGAAVGPAGFPTMPFDFAFTGSFGKLHAFLTRLDDFVKVRGEQVSVRGRLLTVDGFALSASPAGFPSMTAAVHATAYLLPPGETAAAAAVSPAPSAAGPTAAAGAAVPTAAATATGVGTR